MKKVLTLTIFALLFVCPCFADCGDTKLVGSLLNETSYGNITQANYFKALRWQAVASGVAGCFKINIYNHGNVTSDNVGYALYTDNNDTPGALKASGYTTGYNWTTIGNGIHTFEFNTINDGSITAGQWYWIAFTNNNLSVYWPRNGPSRMHKQGYSGATYSNPPPSGAVWSTGFGDSSYAWFVVDNESGGSGEVLINSASMTWEHGGTGAISGVNFGIKNPVAPLLWDDCTSNPPLSTYYDEYLPTSAQQGSTYNMSYRSLPFRGIDGSNSRVNYILGGAHAIDRGTDTYTSGGVVGVGKNINSHKYFISYYYRVDPQFDEEDHPDYTDNMKELVLSNTEGSYYPDGDQMFGYYCWCTNTVPDVNNTDDIRFLRMPIDPNHQEYPYSCSQDDYIVYHNNPINGWIKMQWEGNYNSEYNAPQINFTTYPDGNRTYESHYGDGLTTMEYFRGYWLGFPKENDLRFIGIGGFGRIPRENNGVNSFRYFASIYIDSTHSRIMLGDNQNYDACTIMEPQIPSTWNDNSITVKVNLGSLPDEGTAYLFVFNSNNTRNAVGYPVTLNGNVQLSPPENLEIVDTVSNP